MSQDDKLSVLDTWYKQGLRFKCTECGQCCTGSPGSVWVNEEEIEKMAAYLNITCEEFVKKYTRLLYGRLSLREFPRPSYDCIFLKGKKCQIYPARPKQCRNFPWWPENLSSKESWQEAARRCEGMNHPDGKLFSVEEIQSELHKD
jgi:hypothetical protein